MKTSQNSRACFQQLAGGFRPCPTRPPPVADRKPEARRRGPFRRRWRGHHVAATSTGAHSRSDAGPKMLRINAGDLVRVRGSEVPCLPPGASAMSAPRSVRSQSRPARSRSQRFCSACTRALRLEISSAMVPAARVSWSSAQRSARRIPESRCRISDLVSEGQSMTNLVYVHRVLRSSC
jgi:hypothetical protein